MRNVYQQKDDVRDELESGKKRKATQEFLELIRRERIRMTEKREMN